MAMKDSWKKGIANAKTAGVKAGMEAAQKKIDIRQKLNESLAKLGAKGISEHSEHTA